MLRLGLRVTDLDRSLAFYTALGYAELGRVPETEFGSLSMLQLPGDPFVSLELVYDPVRPVKDIVRTALYDPAGQVICVE
jgi:hypothetical protein